MANREYSTRNKERLLNWCQPERLVDEIDHPEESFVKMNDRAEELQQLILKHVPSAGNDGGIGHDVPLGAGGLGLDSVAIVMLLLECEARWGVSFPAELLEQQPLTLGRLVDHLHGHAGP